MASRADRVSGASDESQLQQLFPNILGRLLHQQLWQRLVDFATKYTPEVPVEGIVQLWLQRFYAGDASLILLVRINNQMQITEHVLAEVQQLPGYKVLHMYQVQLDTPRAGHLDELHEAMVKYGTALGCTFLVARVHEHVRAYEKKYHFTSIGTTLIKSLSADASSAEEEENS